MLETFIFKPSRASRNEVYLRSLEASEPESWKQADQGNRFVILLNSELGTQEPGCWYLSSCVVINGPVMTSSSRIIATDVGDRDLHDWSLLTRKAFQSFLNDDE